MYPKYKLSAILFALGGIALHAQSDVILFNSVPVDPDRYEDIKGSPYIFKDWMKADIIPTAGEKIEGVEINFNGYTQQFEVRKNSNYIELREFDFIGIKLHECKSTCLTQSFLKYSHPKRKNRYPLFVYNGPKYKLIKDFRTSLVNNKVESPGKTVNFESFNDVATYYLLRDQSLELIKLTRKAMLEHLAVPEAESYVKEAKLDLSTEEGACQLFQWLEQNEK